MQLSQQSASHDESGQGDLEHSHLEYSHCKGVGGQNEAAGLYDVAVLVETFQGSSEDHRGPKAS